MKYLLGLFLLIVIKIASANATDSRAPGSDASVMPEQCFFDHQLMTLKQDEYQQIRSFFADEANRTRVGVSKWADNGFAKFFLWFGGRSYIEVWNEASPWSIYGFQEGCRVMDQKSLQTAEKHFNGKIKTWENCCDVIGSNGVDGVRAGGHFFIFYPRKKPPIPQMEIFEIQTLVPQDKLGQVLSDYTFGGLKIEEEPSENLTRVIDSGGATRIIRTAAVGQNGGMIAIRYPYSGADRSVLRFDETNSDSMYLKLEENVGTIVFNPALYEKFNP